MKQAILNFIINTGLALNNEKITRFGIRNSTELRFWSQFDKKTKLYAVSLEKFTVPENVLNEAILSNNVGLYKKIYNPKIHKNHPIETAVAQSKSEIIDCINEQIMESELEIPMFGSVEKSVSFARNVVINRHEDNLPWLLEGRATYGTICTMLFNTEYGKERLNAMKFNPLCENDLGKNLITSCKDYDSFKWLINKMEDKTREMGGDIKLLHHSIGRGIVDLGGNIEFLRDKEDAEYWMSMAKEAAKVTGNPYYLLYFESTQDKNDKLTLPKTENTEIEPFIL